MTKTMVELNLSTAFGLALLLIGVVVLCIVAFSSYQLATGAVQPLQVGYTQIGGYTITRETSISLGILLQIGMFAVLVGVAYTFMRFGVALVLRKAKEE